MIHWHFYTYIPGEYCFPSQYIILFTPIRLLCIRCAREGEKKNARDHGRDPKTLRARVWTGATRTGGGGGGSSSAASRPAKDKNIY